jgi:hypothetical protein
MGKQAVLKAAPLAHGSPQIHTDQRAEKESVCIRRRSASEKLSSIGAPGAGEAPAYLLPIASVPQRVTLLRIERHHS